MSQAANHVELTADVAAPRDDVFSFFTTDFGELWAGKMSEIAPAPEGSEPMGLGYRRRVNPPGMPGHLDEEIVTHERPSLIEYKVTNDDEAVIRNHLGRIEFGDSGAGTHVRYTIDFDYKPAFLGPVVRGILKAGWAMRGRRVLRKRFG